MRGRTRWLHTSGCLEQRVAPSTSVCLAPTPSFISSWLILHAWPRHTPAVHPSSGHPSVTVTIWNFSLTLQRGVSWGAALISHPWQSMTFWWDHEYPVMHCLRHSVLELCGWSSKQQFHFLPCWMTSNLWKRWRLSWWVGVLLPSNSTLVDEMGRVSSRGETQSPFPHTVMLSNLLKLLTDPSQPPVLILGNRATPPTKTKVVTPEDEDNVYRQVSSCWFAPFWSYYSSLPAPCSQVGPRHWNTACQTLSKNTFSSENIDSR